jgi:Family of unknown function (DUF6111)
MGRVVVLDVLLFLLPFAAYAVWLVVTRGSLANATDWQIKTIAFLGIAGAVLLVGTLVVFVTFQTSPPGHEYEPAHLENGQIVHGKFD